MYKTVHSCIYVCRKAVLPIESEPSPVDTDYDSQSINTVYIWKGNLPTKESQDSECHKKADQSM